ncbi:MAG: hypothetical protein JWO17_2618 [Actinomycetia bacterium]|nr:hypothetical protein [Actinomycetes bacterium]
MWGTGFATQVIAPVANGQPHLIARPIRWSAHVIAAHPLAWDLLFAWTQLLIGLALLIPRAARLALAVSLAWSLGVWIFGEGLGGLAGGGATLPSGAPGGAFLYGLLAAAAWPHRDRPAESPADWLPIAWALLWVGGAVLQALAGEPTAKTVALVAVEALIGLSALHPNGRPFAAAAGFVFALAMWVVSQDFGGLYTGQATDPNSAPLIALMAVALLAPRATTTRSTQATRG